MQDESESIAVLHVDDEPHLTEVIAEILVDEAESFDIITANTVNEGLDLLAQREVDCIISDYDMPGQNGLDFLERVRESYPELPFILYTGQGSEAVAAEAISAGATDYFQKQSGSEQYRQLANRIKQAVSVHQSNVEIDDTTEHTVYKERHQQVFSRIKDAVIEVNDDWEITFLNERTEDVTGLDRMTLLGRDFWDVFLEARGTRFEDDYRQAMHTRESASFVDYYAGLDEWFDISVYPNGDGGLAFYFLPITEHRERAAELAETNQLLSTLLETLPVGVTVLNTDGRIVKANQRAEDVLGLTESDITSRTYHDPEWEIVDADGAPIADTDLPFAQVMETGERVLGYEHRIKWPDGRDRLLSINATPITTENGEIEQVVTTLRDITDTREYEQSLEAQNERLEQFASIVSHDLRNPLTVARGRLEVVAAECDSEHISAIDRAHERMETLISDLLTLARDGESTVELSTVALAPLTERCWETVDTKNATLQSTGERTLQADENRLRQLFENIFRNSIDHGGTEVTVTVGELADGFYIEDDGPGIPEGDWQTVFDPGYSTAEQGTGFGLSIVKQVVDAHDWAIEITEGTKGGARFEITGVEFDTV